MVEMVRGRIGLLSGLLSRLRGRAESIHRSEVLEESGIEEVGWGLDSSMADCVTKCVLGEKQRREDQRDESWSLVSGVHIETFTSPFALTQDSRSPKVHSLSLYDVFLFRGFIFLFCVL